MQKTTGQKITLIYDGECPFCRRYAQYVKLKDVAGVELINARESANPAVQDAKARGYNLDKGMVAIIGGQYYHGDEALHVLALMSSRSDFFNRLNYFLFSSRKISVLAYPFLRMFRDTALWLKGVQKIHS